MLARVYKKFSSVGIISGVWTVTASLGSKVQTLALLAIITRLHGLPGAGLTISIVSAGLLVATLVDMGLSTQVLRLAAQGSMAKKTSVLSPVVLRLAVLIPLGVGGALAVLSATGSLGDFGLWSASIVIYSVGYYAALVMTQLAYGAGRFKSTAALNGALRAGSVLGMMILANIGAGPFWFVFFLGTVELVIAAVQYFLVFLPISDLGDASHLLRPRHTWKYGLGGIANTMMNRSDTVAVSLVTTAAALGTYGLASQVENALTTGALIPAGALVAFTARASSDSERRSIGSWTSMAVFCSYGVLAIPALMFTRDLIRLGFGAEIADVMPFQICIVAGLFSCLGGVAMQQLTGQGSQSAVAIIWTGCAIFAVSLLMIGGWLWGALGAAIAALLRDIAFFSASWLVLRFSAKKNVKKAALQLGRKRITTL